GPGTHDKSGRQQLGTVGSSRGWSGTGPEMPAGDPEAVLDCGPRDGPHGDVGHAHGACLEPTGERTLRQVGAAHSMTLPPAMSRVTPVIHEDAEEARNRAAAATSWGWPRRPSGKPAPSSLRRSSGTQERILSFSTADGAMQLARIPAPASSLARWRLKATTPALAAAYAAEDCAAWRAAAEDMVMMTPECAAIMSGRNAEMVRKVEVRSDSTTLRQLAAVSAAVGTGMPSPPAKAASTSIGPSWSLTCWWSASRSASTGQSAATPIARPPRESMASTTAAMASRSRPVTATATLLAARARAVAAPMPREPPVTTATCPARSGVDHGFGRERVGHAGTPFAVCRAQTSAFMAAAVTQQFLLLLFIQTIRLS